MKGVDAHLDQVLATVAPLTELELRLLDAHGCVLAEDVVADRNVPAYDSATADGYAVRSADVRAPVTLHVAGDVHRGRAPGFVVQPGYCARVFSGAVLPSGADAVVPADWTDGGLAQVRIDRAVPPGAFVRPVGADVAAGTKILARDTLLGAAQVGLLVAVGRRNVLARPKPRVVVVSVGAELAEPGRDLGPGVLGDAAGYAVSAAVREAGAIAFQAGIVADEPKQLTDVLEDHLIQADLVVIVGGIRSGPYDVVRDVLSRIGNVAFHDLAMEPAAAQGLGTVGSDRIPVFAIPGDASGALVAFEVFVRPAIRRMLGAETLGRPRVTAAVTRAFASPEGRRQFVRVLVERTTDRWVATPAAGGLAGLASANGLAVVPEDVTEVAEGTALLTWLLERRGL